MFKLIFRYLLKNKHLSSFILTFGNTLIQLEQYNKAIIILNLCRSILPEWQEPKINLANIYMEQEKYKKAQKLFEEVDVTNLNSKTHAIYLHQKAVFYQRLGMFKKAILCYTHPIVINCFNYDQECSKNLAGCYRSIGNLPKAVHFAERSLSLAKSPKTFGEPGYSNSQNGKYFRAQHLHQECSQALYSDLNYKEYLAEISNEKIKESISLRRSAPFKNQLNEVKNWVTQQQKVCFFVGAGISYPSPTCIPLVSTILNIIINMFLTVEADILNDIIIEEPNKTLREFSIEEIAQVLFNRPGFPFEQTFQNLTDILSDQAISFVELLRDSEPNIHHFMLASAIKNGASVITTNFDQNIEKAFSIMYPNEELNCLVTDLDYQRYEESEYKGPVLAKIHGCLDIYRSLALASKGILSNSDMTSHNFEHEISKFHTFDHPDNIMMNSLLSMPKDMFLQDIFSKSALVFLGYSASDTADINPIIKKYVDKTQILWICHRCEDSSNITGQFNVKYKENGSFKIIQPYNPTDVVYDLTAAVSTFIMLHYNTTIPDCIKNELSPDKNELSSIKINTNLQPFVSKMAKWMANTGIRLGDGCVFFAEFFNAAGRLETAIKLYKKAIACYDSQDLDSTFRFHSAIIKCAKCYLELENYDNFMELLQYAQSKLYPFLQECNINMILVNMEKNLNTGQLSFFEDDIDKVNSFINSRGHTRISIYLNYLNARYLLMNGDYKNALTNINTVILRATSTLGDGQIAVKAFCCAAECYASYGKEMEAREMIKRAGLFADFLQNTLLKETIDKSLSKINEIFSLPSHRI